MKKIHLLIGVILILFVYGNILADGGSVKQQTEAGIKDGPMIIVGSSITDAWYKTRPRTAGEAIVSGNVILETIRGNNTQIVSGEVKGSAYARTWRVDPGANGTGSLDASNLMQKDGVVAIGTNSGKAVFSAHGPNLAQGQFSMDSTNVVFSDGKMTKVETSTRVKTESMSW